LKAVSIKQSWNLKQLLSYCFFESSGLGGKVL